MRACIEKLQLVKFESGTSVPRAELQATQLSTVLQPEVAGSVRGRRASDSRKCKQRIVNIIYYSLCSVYKMS